MRTLSVALSAMTLFVCHRTDAADGGAVDLTAAVQDLFAWMSEDGSRLHLAMTVDPGEDGKTAQFSTDVLYVFHTSSRPSPGFPGNALDILCRFEAQQKIHCWVGSRAYAEGDPSNTKGLSSPDGKLRVFAGPRANPFFFNRDGFTAAASAIHAQVPSLMVDANGCPKLDGAASQKLLSTLSHASDGQSPPVDAFHQTYVLALVVSVDKSLVTAGGPIVSVWAATHEPNP